MGKHVLIRLLAYSDWLAICNGERTDGSMVCIMGANLQ